ncbi:MAG TPA: hypoxanthine phosphoribosyltransferase [Dehalococcoidia bacterium]|nr:hypoxanthine phosphoribosyltransferase [Dehalococcoidia bacterium]
MAIPLKPLILITKEEIHREVFRLAQEISIDYHGKNPLLLGILKGSFVFMADLVRLLEIPVEIEFASLSSYGSAKVSSGKIRVVKGLRSPLEGRDVLVVEDIVDTGLSISHLLGYLHKRKPASVKLCALLDKPDRRKTIVPIDYLGITIPDRFVVGYGLDFDEKFRNLPDICTVED